MKIVFAYEGDAAMSRSQSGRPYAILREFERRGIEVVPAFPLRRPSRWWCAPAVLAAKLAGRHYRPDRSGRRLRAYAQQIERVVAAHRPDLLFAPGSTTIALANVACPILFCADATFGSMVDFYPQFTNLSARYLQEGMAQEAAALKRSAASLFPSRWAARSAVEDHGANPETVHIVPFGASIAGPPVAQVEQAIDARPADQLALLFVGREWVRKGGPLAHRIAAVLHARGVPVTLHVVGPDTPPEPFGPFVTFYGKLNSDDPAQREALRQLFLTSHFQLSLSQAEAFGLAVCDGMAHGLPAIGHSVGGMTDAVLEGRNGHSFPPGVAPETVAERLAAYVGVGAPQARYRTLARNALNASRTHFNWSSFVDRLLAIAADVCAARAGR